MCLRYQSDRSHQSGLLGDAEVHTEQPHAVNDKSCDEKIGRSRDFLLITKQSTALQLEITAYLILQRAIYWL